MKTLISILSEILSETFDKPDSATWKEDIVYRPGLIRVPADLQKSGPPSPRFLPRSRKK